MNDKPVTIRCGDEELVGILSVPENTEALNTGVVITVGGPQYRVGSHRQFLTLARALADKGFYVLRFDYRGIGDSTGESISFEEAGPDICAAVDTLLERIPSLDSIVLWGLCDAASINLIYAGTDDRITGLVLLNPWIRTDAGQAKTELKHYYSKRFFDQAFWRKLLSNKVDIVQAAREFFFKIVAAVFSRFSFSDSEGKLSLPELMEKCFFSFSGRILLIISGNDLTASEFMDRVESSKPWKKKIDSTDIDLIKLEDADHTFSKQEWKEAVISHTHSWLKNVLEAEMENSKN